MKYQAAINIWNLTEQERKALQIGQWVYAGDPSNKGRFYGQGCSTVVAWLGNGKNRWTNYCRAIHQYGQTVTKI